LDKRNRALRAPDPRLLLDLLPDELFRKITEAKFCLIVDDDGTISDSHPMYIDWLARKLKRPLKPEDNTRYDFLDIDPQALGMLKAGVFGNARMHRHLPVIPGAVSALREISKKGIPIVILTARPPQKEMVRVTYDHKVDHRIPFDLMIFSRRKKEIVKAIKHLVREVVLVDDDPNVVTAASSLKGVTALLFFAFYNQRTRRKGVVPVKNWGEVLVILRNKIMNGRR